VRDMRFDEKIRVDLPTRRRGHRFWPRSCRDGFGAFGLILCQPHPGWSAAKLTGLVNKAASDAACDNRRIEERDLQRAFDRAVARTGR